MNLSFEWPKYHLQFLNSLWMSYRISKKKCILTNTDKYKSLPFGTKPRIAGTVRTLFQYDLLCFHYKFPAASCEEACKCIYSDFPAIKETACYLFHVNHVVPSHMELIYSQEMTCVHVFRLMAKFWIKSSPIMSQWENLAKFSASAAGSYTCISGSILSIFLWTFSFWKARFIATPQVGKYLEGRGCLRQMTGFLFSRISSTEARDCILLHHYNRTASPLKSGWQANRAGNRMHHVANTTLSSNRSQSLFSSYCFPLA